MFVKKLCVLGRGVIKMHCINGRTQSTPWKDSKPMNPVLLHLACKT